jgi:hypothetical protein
MSSTYYAILTRNNRVVDVRNSWPAAARSRVRYLEIHRFVPTGFVSVFGYQSLQQAWVARWTDVIGKHGRVA